MSRKMISVPETLWLQVKDRYPDLNWTQIISLLLEDTIPEGVTPALPKEEYVTQDQLKELKDKFNDVITKLIEKNNLTY